MSGPTPNFGFVKPTVGASNNTWGGTTNTNWDIVDSKATTTAAVNTLLAGYLPLSGGGTVSGTVAADTFTVSGGMSLYNGGGNQLIDHGGNSVDAFTSASALRQWTCAGAVVMNIQSNGVFTISGGTAYKPGGGSWTTYSDARIKDVVAAYGTAVAEVRQLQPVIYRYRGNDTEPGNPEARDTTTQFYGLVAQEAEAAMPELVTKHDGWVDGEPVDDLRHLDTTALLFALVNCVRELDDRLRAFEER
jgi:hypothetical protein